MNAQIPVYTIGYGNRSIEQFVETLKKYQIAFVIDVRSRPYSQFKPEFSKDQLEKTLKLSGVQYVFMGDTLGGRPDDEKCYTDGKVDYKKLKNAAFYAQGISRLKTAWDKQLNVVLMCSEGKPQECHRAKLIGETLSEIGIEVLHIDETGNVKTQVDVISLITNGQLSLIGQPSVVSTSRKKYNPSKTHTE